MPFLGMRGFQNPPKAGHYQPFKWRVAGRPNIKCWLGIFVIFQGIRISIAKKPYKFEIFQGGGGSGPTVATPSDSTYALYDGVVGTPVIC